MGGGAARTGPDPHRREGCYSAGMPQGPPGRVLILIGLGVGSIFIAAALAVAGPKAALGCPAAGWTGYVPVASQVSAGQGYLLDGSLWIPACRQIPTGP